MVDIEARITIEVRVENYEEVVSNKGRLLGTVARVPKVDSFVKGKVDETIEKEVKRNLERTLLEKPADELTRGLAENGVSRHAKRAEQDRFRYRAGGWAGPGHGRHPLPFDHRWAFVVSSFAFFAGVFILAFVAINYLLRRFSDL